jgi:hypothetical protein
MLANCFMAAVPFQCKKAQGIILTPDLGKNERLALWMSDT